MGSLVLVYLGARELHLEEGEATLQAPIPSQADPAPPNTENEWSQINTLFNKYFLYLGLDPKRLHIN